MKKQFHFDQPDLLDETGKHLRKVDNVKDAIKVMRYISPQSLQFEKDMLRERLTMFNLVCVGAAGALCALIQAVWPGGSAIVMFLIISPALMAVNTYLAYRRYRKAKQKHEQIMHMTIPPETPRDASARETAEESAKETTGQLSVHAREKQERELIYTANKEYVEHANSMKDVQDLFEANEKRQRQAEKEQSLSAGKLPLMIMKAVFVYLLPVSMIGVTSINLADYWLNGIIKGNLTFNMAAFLVCFAFYFFLIVYRYIRNKTIRVQCICLGICALITVISFLDRAPKDHPIKNMLMALLIVIAILMAFLFFRSLFRKQSLPAACPCCGREKKWIRRYNDETNMYECHCESCDYHASYPAGKYQA